MNHRPLSPHLGVYKLLYTMVLSILHRITGVAATFGFLAFTWWLMALATGPESYARAMRSGPGRSSSSSQAASVAAGPGTSEAAAAGIRRHRLKLSD